MGDGELRVTAFDDLVPGAILREYNRRDGTTPQHGDSTIVSVSYDGKTQLQVRLVRPHISVYADGRFTVGVEQYEAPASRLVGEESIFRTVCLSRGQPANVLRPAVREDGEVCRPGGPSWSVEDQG